MTWDEFDVECANLAARWADKPGLRGVYGVPRGGVPVAVRVASLLGLPIMDSPTRYTLVVDDLVDSGATLARYEGLPVDALYRKPHSPSYAPGATLVDGWIDFPWESNETGPEDAVARLIQWVGDDPTRNGLRNTPGRVTRALRELLSGYDEDAAAHLAVTFDDNCDQMVVVSGIKFTSMCEHHMLPFTGTATVGYLPNGNVVGLSKLARTVDVFARRLQVQERLTEQVADAMDTHLAPLGCGVVITAHHSCMGLRGALKPDALMTTSALRGKFLHDPTVRSEFLGFR